MKFNVDKSKVSEGESFNVSWECSNPGMVSLTIEDGTKNHIQLPDSGVRAILASGNSDKINIILKASVGGKIEEKKACVKVRRKVLKAERVDRAPRSHRPSSKFSFSRIGDWFKKQANMFKTAWSYMSADKKLAYRILGLIMVTMVLTSFSPKLLAVGLGGTVGYLIWQIFKK